jgi:membrane fusion protein (multidrug efflux system)
MSAADKTETADARSSKTGEVVQLNATAERPVGRKRRRRVILMLALPLAIATGGAYWWITGGRFMSTENAYVHQHMVALSADVSGRIVEVDAIENQTVHGGDIIFRLDPEPFRIALEQTNAALSSARLEVEQLRAAYQGALADEESARQTADYYKTEFDRQQTLAKNGFATRAKLDAARHDLEDAQQKATAAGQRAARALAALGGNANISADEHPLVMKALAERDRAKLDLAYTTVRAPSDGVVSQTDRLNVGQYVTAASTVATLVESDSVWIEANFKETELTHMGVGQTATVSVDAYPDREFTGKVASIGAGTGSEFALLPAQNASGNWVKVVQRVPVRIEIDKIKDVDIRAGMSAYVSVDTRYERPLPDVVTGALELTGISAAAAPRN